MYSLLCSQISTNTMPSANAAPDDTKLILNCFIILAAIVGLAIFALIVSIVLYRYQNGKNKDTSDQVTKDTSDQVTADARRRCNNWYFMEITWLIAEYLSIVLSFACTVIILYFDVYTECKSGIFVFSVLSMLLIIMAYVIRPHEHAAAYRKAFFQLDKAIRHHDDSSDNNINRAIDIGESIISGVFGIGINELSQDSSEEKNHQDDTQDSIDN